MGDYKRLISVKEWFKSTTDYHNPIDVGLIPNWRTKVMEDCQRGLLTPFAKRMVEKSAQRFESFIFHQSIDARVVMELSAKQLFVGANPTRCSKKIKNMLDIVK